MIRHLITEHPQNEVMRVLLMAFSLPGASGQCSYPDLTQSC